jgi:hypothetical protein
MPHPLHHSGKTCTKADGVCPSPPFFAFFSSTLPSPFLAAEAFSAGEDFLAM